MVPGIILDLFFLLIQVFFVNRLIMILVIYIKQNGRNTKKWILALTTLMDIVLLYVYAFNDLWMEITTEGQQFTTSSIVLLVLRICVIVFMYFTQINNLYGRIRLKSRRQKEFERTMQGKEKSYLTQFIVGGVGLIAGIISLIYYKINYTSDYKDNFTISIIIIVASVLLLVCTIVFMILNKKKLKTASSQSEVVAPHSTIISNKVRTCIFIIQDNEQKMFYKTEYKGKVNLSELVGVISDYYYISSYGILKTNGEEYDLYGFKTSSFDHGLITNIKMDRFESKAVESILPYLEKNRSKIFNLDENNNPINSFDA